MPWKEVTVMSLRNEFVMLALNEDSDISKLCKRFNISRKTGYKWIKRFLGEGKEGLFNRSRRPGNSPNKTKDDVEALVLQIRDNHPAWGGRKIRRRLINLGHKYVPAGSTITEILKRNNRIDDKESEKHKSWVRFEAEKPNDLWQMDFKGWFKIKNGECHTLTILDDNSRFSLGIEACVNERAQTVKKRLIPIFRRYGMPVSILCDNGPPFGASTYSPYTSLGAWLIRLGIKIIHGRPCHPQTQGKDERFHRTLQAEVLNYINYELLMLNLIQKKLNEWRYIYNFERPHESLNMQVPIDRYCESKREYPEVLPQIEYSPDDFVQKVGSGGRILYKGNKFRVGKAFIDEYVAVRPTVNDNIKEVYYCNQMIKKLNLRY